MRAQQRKLFWLVIGVTAFILTGCGGGGGGGETPTDSRTLTTNYFPNSQGSLINYEGRTSTAGTLTDRFFNALTVVGPGTYKGKAVTVLSESNPENSGSAEEFYYDFGNDAIYDYGNNDLSDTITPQLAPYQLVRFPMATGNSFVQLNKTGLIWDTDEDGDGTPETFDVYSVVTLSGFETLTLNGVDFADTARLVTASTITVHFSAGGSGTLTGTQTLWCAPDYGPLKRSVTIAGETTVEEAVGMKGSFGTVGLMPQFVPLTDLAPGTSNTEQPGRPAVASDGTNFLIVSAQTDSTTLDSTLVGALVDSDGTPLTTVTIAGLANDAQFSHPAVIFDGANYLVVYQTAGEIHGRFIQPSGTPNGAAFILSNDTSNWQPVLAFDGARALVAWAKYNGTDYDIYGAFVDNIGPDTAEFPLVNDSDGQDEPTIAFGGGNYLVLYRNYAAVPVDEYGDIYGRRFNINGVGLAPSPMPVCTAAHGQGSPQLAFDDTNFFAVWVDLRDGLYDIYGSGIDTAGNVLDGPTDTGGIAINTRADILRAYPAVSFNGTDYLVTWAAGDPGGTPASLLNSGIFANRVSTTGALVDAAATDLGIAISEPPAAANQYIYPVVHFNGSHSLLTWVDNTQVSGETKNLRALMIWPY